MLILQIQLLDSNNVHDIVAYFTGNVVNIADGATCNASCHRSHNNKCTPCKFAIDGDRDSGWQYKGAAVGGWLLIMFNWVYNVSALNIALPYFADHRNIKDVKLAFSDGSEQMVSKQYWYWSQFN